MPLRLYDLLSSVIPYEIGGLVNTTCDAAVTCNLISSHPPHPHPLSLHQQTSVSKPVYTCTSLFSLHRTTVIGVTSFPSN